MRTPVIIAARNEEAFIGGTLDALDAATTEPIVVVNDSSDNTANIARGFGAEVYEVPEAGKLLAQQFGLKKLGARALEPVLMTDADTYPMYPSRWTGAMLRGLRGDKTAVSGLYIAREDEPLLQRSIISGLRVGNVIMKKLTHAPHASGGNMLLHLRDTQALDRIMALGNHWVFEDVAMIDAATDGDPDKHHITYDPRAIVRTSSRFLPPLKSLVTGGRQSALESATAERLARAADGTAPYKLT